MGLPGALRMVGAKRCRRLYQTGTFLAYSTVSHSGIYLSLFISIRWNPGNGPPDAPVPTAGACGPQLRGRRLEFHMGALAPRFLAACGAFLGLLSVVLIPTCRAQSPNLSGRYECIQVRQHQTVSACSAAPLILKSDGRFELRGWEGSYLVNGEWVVLSDSLLKARARIR